MEFETELLIVSARHFKGKSDGKDYYMLDCLTTTEEKNNFIHGYQGVPVFIDEVQYNSILNIFKPLMRHKFIASLSGNRVQYKLKV